MKRMIVTFGLLTLIPTQVQAQVNNAMCEFLPVKEHFVGADYVPGVDVDGNPVIPADVKQQADRYLDVIKIPVNIELVRNMGLDAVVPAGTEMQGNFGVVEVHKDSTVKYNGEVITTQAYAYCGKQPFDIENAIPEPDTQPEPAAEPQELVEGEKEDIIWAGE